MALILQSLTDCCVVCRGRGLVIRTTPDPEAVPRDGRLRILAPCPHCRPPHLPILLTGMAS